MPITRVVATNFKSFRSVDVELGQFTAVVGQNASGKSNFLSVFRFVRDLATVGLDDAISMQGGVRFLRNVRQWPERELHLGFHYREPRPVKWSFRNKVELQRPSFVYDLIIRFAKRGPGYEVARETLAFELSLAAKDPDRNRAEPRTYDGRLTLTNDSGRFSASIEPDEGLPVERNALLFDEFFKGTSKDKKRLLIEGPFLPILPPLDPVFAQVALYDFDPKLPKRAVPLSGKTFLEEDGSNLSLVLQRIGRHRKNREKLHRLVRDVLPFVDRLEVDNFADNSLLFKLREVYSAKSFVPASLVSDGTINVVALIIALYFERHPVIAIEEPERNIHPRLLSRVVEMIRDASAEKQVLVSTHNPEVVRNARLEDLLFVARDQDGYSTLTRPAASEVVRAFLASELGLDELYVQGLLGL
jgi:predicted ATPase